MQDSPIDKPLACFHNTYMHTPEFAPESVQFNGFRATPPVGLWSACISGAFTYPKLERALVESATRDGRGYTGFVAFDTYDPDPDCRTFFTCTRYPRQDGVTPLKQCEEGIALLANELGTSVEPDPQTDGIRVVLGLREGYDDEGAYIHTHEEVMNALRSIPTVRIQRAAILAVRATAADTSTRIEPVAVIRGSYEGLFSIYRLADRFRQTQFTVEDFARQISWVVQTPHCTEP